MKILFAHDNTVFAQAIRRALRAHGLDVTLLKVGQLDGIEADQGGPDVALVDVSMPGPAGIETGKKMLRRYPQMKVLGLAAPDNPGALPAAALAGFHGCVLADVSISQLVLSIQAAFEGPMARPSRRIGSVVPLLTDDERDAALLAQHLTCREREVLALLVEGQTGQAISQSLSLSVHTVRTHIQNVLTKLQVHSRLAAATFAIRYGIAGDPGWGRSPVMAGGEGAA